MMLISHHYIWTSNGCLFRLGANDILRVGKDSGDIRVVASQPVILYGDPTVNLEAATKQYVDIRRICNNVGLIPIINSNLANRNNYIASASSEFNNSYQAYNAFNFSAIGNGS